MLQDQRLKAAGQRLRSFLDRIGHSYRDSAAISKLNHETIRRICLGIVGPTTEYQLKRIVETYRAAGYEITSKQLLEGEDPRSDFEWTVQNAESGQRVRYMVMSEQQRVRLTLTYLEAQYPEICRADRLGAASGLDSEVVDLLLHRWESRQPDTTTTHSLARGLHRLTGICMTWFTNGWLDTESPDIPITEGTDEACAGSPVDAQITRVVIRNLRAIVSEGLRSHDARRPDGHAGANR